MATTSAVISASSKLLAPTFLSSSRLSPSSSLLFRSRFNPVNKPLHLTQSRSLTPIRSFSASPATATKTIAVSDTLPEATLSYFPATSDELQTVTISELTKSKKAVLFAVPGAFTPTCSQKHLPGFAEKAKELKSKGVDVIACISVNDAFVMKAWKEDLKIGDEVMLLSDGNGDFTRAIGAELDLSDKPVGLGVRSRRYAMLVDDGVVKVLNLEEGGAFTNSSAEDMLKAL